jgi:hypothetical protein
MMSFFDYDANHTGNDTLKLTQRGVALGLGVCWGDGVGAILMKNQNGVSIQLTSLSKGVRIKLSVGGVEFKLK